VSTISISTKPRTKRNWKVEEEYERDARLNLNACGKNSVFYSAINEKSITITLVHKLYEPRCCLLSVWLLKNSSFHITLRMHRPTHTHTSIHIKNILYDPRTFNNKKQFYTYPPHRRLHWVHTQSPIIYSIIVIILL